LKRFNEALQRFRIYALSYEALHRFIEALGNLTRPLTQDEGHYRLKGQNRFCE